MPRKLKVFRTAIGFHDAYVAAPSRKAALDAWGANADLFARAVAEKVTDAKLMKAPLAKPGEVIRVSRGGLSEHLKALPKRKRRQAAAAPAAEPERRAKPKPPPRRDKIEAADKALTALAERQQADIEMLQTKQAKERTALERKRDKAREAYRKALDAWSE